MSESLRYTKCIENNYLNDNSRYQMFHEYGKLTNLNFKLMSLQRPKLAVLTVSQASFSGVGIYFP